METQAWLSIAVVIGVSMVGCGESRNDISTTRVTSAMQQDIRERTKLQFPETTRFLMYELIERHDDRIWLVIEMPELDLDSFLKQPLLKDVRWSKTTNSIKSSIEHEAWRPEELTQFRSMSFHPHSGETMKITIDDSQRDPKVIYIVWYQM